MFGQDASESWGLSVSFISIILLPIVGNAAEHAGAIIFAFKNKLVSSSFFLYLITFILICVILNTYEIYSSRTRNIKICGLQCHYASTHINANDLQDISLGVALGSATQIGLFVVPLTIIVAWILGINMDLNFNLLETGSLALSIIITAFTLQVKTFFNTLQKIINPLDKSIED